MEGFVLRWGPRAVCERVLRCIADTFSLVVQAQDVEGLREGHVWFRYIHGRCDGSARVFRFDNVVQ